jgi:cephalosporin hydroxylase
MRALRRVVARPATALFHWVFYGSFEQTWEATTWLGTRAKKCPLDLWIYQEIIAEQHPDLIVETGTAHGGSALFLASLCDLVGHGHVVSVDVEEGDRPAHPRITYLHGSSTAPEILTQVRERAEGTRSRLILLDSDHSKGHVLRELEAYAPLVHVGGYVVVEDTNVNGHPVAPRYGPGPFEAVEEFLSHTDAFEVDRAREKLMLTFNPSGYLRRVRPDRAGG